MYKKNLLYVVFDRNDKYIMKWKMKNEIENQREKKNTLKKHTHKKHKTYNVFDKNDKTHYERKKKCRKNYWKNYNNKIHGKINIF